MIDFFRNLRDFLQEAKKDGGLIGKMRDSDYNDAARSSTSAYEQLFRGRAWEFAKNHPYVTAFATEYGIMYIQGWFKNRYMDRALRND